jgi:hypothetical protein
VERETRVTAVETVEEPAEVVILRRECSVTGERFAPRRVKGARAARDRGGTLIAWLAAYGGGGAGRAGCRQRCRSRWRELAPVRVPRAPLRKPRGAR